MWDSNNFDARPLETALAEVAVDALWEYRDMKARRPNWAHHELILARAAELAVSPLARDQLMSLALERQTQNGPPGRPLIKTDCSTEERDQIAGRVFRLAPHKGSDTETFVQSVEARHSQRIRRGAQLARLAQDLEKNAVLQEMLWDHPGIPASDVVRLAMLCSIPKLRARAEDLRVSEPGWWPALNRWLMPSFKRAEQ